MIQSVRDRGVRESGRRRGTKRGTRTRGRNRGNQRFWSLDLLLCFSFLRSLSFSFLFFCLPSSSSPGSFHFIDAAGIEVVEPRAGRCLLFASGAEHLHQVPPVPNLKSSGARCALCSFKLAFPSRCSLPVVCVWLFLSFRCVCVFFVFHDDSGHWRDAGEQCSLPHHDHDRPSCIGTTGPAGDQRPAICNRDVVHPDSRLRNCTADAVKKTLECPAVIVPGLPSQVQTSTSRREHTLRAGGVRMPECA